MRSLYEKLNRLDDSLSEDVAYSYLVYAESGSTDEEGLFDDLRLAKKLAKKIAIKLSEKDPGAYVLIKRGIRGSDVVNDTWKVINRVKYDPKKDSFEFNTPQTPHPLYGMTNENLNEINNSLVESKRIIKNRKLTEGYRVDPKISEFNVGDRVAERYNDSEFNVGTIIDIKKDSEGTQYLVKWDYSDREYEEWLYGDVLSLWVEDETEDNYDDDIDEMLTEDHKEYDEEEWQLIKSDKTYDPEGLDISPADEVLCSGTEERCREEFKKLVVKFKLKELRENPPQLAKVYRYFIKIEKLTDDTLVVYYPQAQSKDIYRLRKVK